MLGYRIWQAKMRSQATQAARHSAKTALVPETQVAFVASDGHRHGQSDPSRGLCAGKVGMIMIVSPNRKRNASPHPPP